MKEGGGGLSRHQNIQTSRANASEGDESEVTQGNKADGAMNESPD